MPVLLETLDQKIATTLADWNLYTTLIAVSIVAFLAYPIVYPSEPDTHPLLLARQASAAPVRNKNESAVYRSPEIPHGYPLKTGLNVKQPDEPRWKSGKDGDLRDIWREVLRGGRVGLDGKEVPQGSIMSVFGKEKVEEHDLAKLSKQINVLGKYWKEAGQGRVAIYLPNNIEYLVTIFACAFYGLAPVLLPHNLPPAKVYELLNLVNADTLVCEAGTLPIDEVARQCNDLRVITSVVPKTSTHMDWTGVPDSVQSRLSIGVWNDVFEDNAAIASATLPNNDIIEKASDLIAVWQSKDSAVKPTITTFTQLHVVSSVAALITALPLRQRVTPSDLLLPAESFSHTYTLAWTLAALFTHASVAINSVAGPSASLAAASRLIAPTIIIAPAETLSKLHAETSATLTSPLHKIGLYTQSQSLSGGRMPTKSSLFLPPSTATNNSPGKLRLILTSDRLGLDSPPLSSSTLSDLRIFTRARIVYALTASHVFGAVAQTHVFDYRREEGEGHSRFGSPVSSVEIRLVGNGDAEVGKSEPVGELVVSGPAVAGGEWRSGRRMRVGEDGCLGYA